MGEEFIKVVQRSRHMGVVNQNSLRQTRADDVRIELGDVRAKTIDG